MKIKYIMHIVQDYKVLRLFIITLFTRLFVRVAFYWHVESTYQTALFH